jgi:hypothetical protein
MYIKIRDGNPSIKSTRQKRTQVDTTQRKNKSKKSTKKKKRKRKKVKTTLLSLIFISYIHENFTKRLFDVLWWMKEVVVTQSLSLVFVGNFYTLALSSK